MASLIKQFKKVTDRTKYGVFGWIRRAEKELRLQHIPSMITSIIIVYFGDDDKFDIIGDDMKLSPNKKLLTKRQNDESWHTNGYGMMEISSLSEWSYQWDLRIEMAPKPNSGIVVGISSTQTPNIDFESNELAFHYTMMVHSNNMMRIKRSEDRSWRVCGRADQKIQKISIRLDLMEKEIGFFVNDKDRAIVLENVRTDLNMHYRLMASIMRIGDSVEILNFAKP